MREYSVLMFTICLLRFTPAHFYGFFCAGDDFFEVICGPLTPLLFFPIAFSVNLKKIMKFVETIQRKKGDTIRRTFSVLKDIDLT